MKIGKNKVVTLNYRLTDGDGNEIDSTIDNQPLSYLHGHGNLVPALEKFLDEKEKGESHKITIAPKDAYGEIDSEMVQKLPRDHFKNGEDLYKGMQFQVEDEGRIILATVIDFNDQEVTLDGNHPLAGTTLNFDLTIVEVVNATDEEIAKGMIDSSCCHEDDCEHNS